MSAPLFLAILFSATTLWSPCHPVKDVYAWDAHLRMRSQLEKLISELVMDAEMKIKPVLHYRSQYTKTLPYQIGNMVYSLREPFKKMVKRYQHVHRNISYDHFDHLENIKNFIEIRRYATHIATHVDMMLAWQAKRATAEDVHNSMKDPLRSGAGRDYESEELLRQGAPPRRGRPPRRKNNKWQHVRGYGFV